MDIEREFAALSERLEEEQPRPKIFIKCGPRASH